MIVSTLPPSADPRLMRANAQRVTLATAALAEMLPAVGVYWKTAENVIEPGRFVEEAKGAGADGAPMGRIGSARTAVGVESGASYRVMLRTTKMCAETVGRASAHIAGAASADFGLDVVVFDQAGAIGGSRRCWGD